MKIFEKIIAHVSKYVYCTIKSNLFLSVRKNFKFFFAKYERKQQKIPETPKKIPKKSIFLKLPVEDLICMENPSRNLKFMPKDNVSHLYYEEI